MYLGTIRNPLPGKTRLQKFRRPLKCINGRVVTHHLDVWIQSDHTHGERGRWKYLKFLTK